MGYHKSFDPKDVWEYATRKLTDVSNIWTYSRRTTSFFKISDTVRMEDTNEYTTTNTSSYDEIKKYLMCLSGRIRIKFKLKNDGGNITRYKIFRNETEVADGYVHSATYTEKTEDIDVGSGDMVIIKMQVSSNTGRMKDIRLCYDFSEDEVIELV